MCSNKSLFISRIFLCLFISVLLVSCGGGGGSDSPVSASSASSPSAPTPSAPTPSAPTPSAPTPSTPTPTPSTPTPSAPRPSAPKTDPLDLPGSDLDPPVTPTTNDVPLLTPERRDLIIQSALNDPTRYSKLVELARAYTVDGRKAYENSSLFPGIVLPLVLFGNNAIAVPSGVAGNWKDVVRPMLIDEIVKHNFNDRNSFRQHAADFMYSYLWLDAYYPVIFSSSDRQKILSVFTKWANHLNTEYANNFLPDDTDEGTSWLEISELLTRTEKGSVLANITNVRNELRDNWMNAKLVAPNKGTMAGGFWNEATSYTANTARFYARWRAVANQTGQPNPDPNWSNKFALLTALLHISDESGVWLWNDHQDQSANGNYAADYPITQPITSHRTHYFTENALLDTTGSAAHKALLYFMENAATQNISNVGSNWNGYQQAMYTNSFVDSIPNSLISIPNLPTFINTGDKGVFAARKDWNYGAPQFFYNQQQMGQQDHVGQGMYYEIWHGGKPITHQSAASSLHNKRNSINTVYIENYGSGRGPDVVTGFFPGSQGPRLQKVEGPKHLAHYSDNNYCVVMSEGKKRYWDNTSYQQQTNFLRQWTRSIINFWDGLTIVYDHLKLDPTDIDDINKRYNTSYSSYTRKSMKVTRMTSVPRAPVNGWYTSTGHNKTGHYKPLNPVRVSEKIINEQKDAPFASSPNSDFYSNNKIAHLQESISANDVQFLGVHAWGDAGVAAPRDENVTVSAGNAIGHAFLHNNKWKVVLFNTNPEIPLKDNVVLKLGNGIPLSGITIYAVGWDKATSFSASIASSAAREIRITSGNGVRPNSGQVLQIAL